MLGQKSFLNDLPDIRAGEVWACFEAALNLGEVIALFLPEVSEHFFEISLRGHKNPRSAVTLCGKAFRHGLQVEHQFGVLADELPHLIHEKVQSKIRPLLIDVLLHFLRKGFNRYPVVGADLVQHSIGFLLGDIEVFGIGIAK